MGRQAVIFVAAMILAPAELRADSPVAPVVVDCDANVKPAALAARKAVWTAAVMPDYLTALDAADALPVVACAARELMRARDAHDKVMDFHRLQRLTAHAHLLEWIGARGITFRDRH